MQVAPMTVTSQMLVAAGSVVWVRFGDDELEGRDGWQEGWILKISYMS